MLGSLALKASDLSPLDIARFWSSVEVDGRSYGPTGKCWPWRGSRQSRGYGNFRLGRRSVLAHRVAFALFHGEAPADLTIRHRCDNEPCCQPGHLLRGSNLDNVLDRVLRQRSATSPLTPADVLAIRALKGRHTQAEVAVMFGVSQGTVSNIWLRRTWNLLADDGSWTLPPNYTPDRSRPRKEDL